MSSRPLRLSLPGLSSRPAMRVGQMSQPKAFVPARVPDRGRAYVRGALPNGARPDLTREAFLAWWSGLMLRRLGSAHAIARRFDVTEQTGRNWVDGFSCPTGLQVMRAQDWWPEDFAQATSRIRRAA